MKYQIMEREGEPSSIIVFHDGKTHIMGKENPSLLNVMDALRAGQMEDAEVVAMFNVERALSRRFERLSERVTINAGRIFFDGDEIKSTLVDTIVTLHEQSATQTGADWMPLVRFLEKVVLNPNEHSRENLYRWLAKNEFGIHEDGDFVAYKGLDQGMVSSSSGTAWVNGEVHRGKIPNAIGTIVEMPRSDVVHDPRIACSTGLHAGTWSYARSFSSGPKVMVKINPRDVVSVPTDASDQKLRVCRYKVMEVVTGPLTSVLYPRRAIDSITTLVGKDAVAYERASQAGPKAKAVKHAERQKELADIGAGLAAVLAGKTKPPRKKAAAKKAEPDPGIKHPSVGQETSYEAMGKRDFANLPVTSLKWLAGQWLVPVSGTKAVLVDRLAKQAAKRRRDAAKLIAAKVTKAAPVKSARSKTSVVAKKRGAKPTVVPPVKAPVAKSKKAATAKRASAKKGSAQRAAATRASRGATSKPRKK